MGYTEIFKMQVVAEYETGKESMGALMRKYDIRGHSTITKWVKKYGKQLYKSLEYKLEQGIQADVFKDKAKLLEELQQARLQVAALEALVEASSRHTGINLKKKFGGKPSS